MGNNPTGKTGKRYVSYPEPGVTKVYYENRVLVIRSDEDQKQYGAKLRAVQKQGHGKYPADVVFTPPAPAKPKRSVKSKAPAKRTAPARKKAVRKSADDVWGKPPAPVFAREEVKAAPRKAAPKGPKYTIVAVCKTGRYDV